MHIPAFSEKWVRSAVPYVFSITYRLRKRVRSRKALLILKDIPGSRKWDLLMAKDIPASLQGLFLCISAHFRSRAVYSSLTIRRPFALFAQPINKRSIPDSCLSRTIFTAFSTINHEAGAGGPGAISRPLQVAGCLPSTVYRLLSLLPPSASPPPATCHMRPTTSSILWSRPDSHYLSSGDRKRGPRQPRRDL